MAKTIVDEWALSPVEWESILNLISHPPPLPSNMKFLLKENAEKERLVQKVNTVNTILNFAWDPIGVIVWQLADGLKLDEYTLYAVRVVNMLEAGATEIEVAEFLANVEAQWMEQEPQAATVYRVARMVCALHKGEKRD